MADEATVVVMTETQKELLKEIQTQYEKAKHSTTQTRNIKLAVLLPLEMLREAFEGVPQPKEGKSEI